MQRGENMVDGICNISGISGVTNYTADINNITELGSGKIPEQSTGPQNAETSFGSVLLTRILNGEGSHGKVEGHLMRTTGIVKGSVDVIVNDSGKVDLTANELVAAIKTQNWTEIKSSELKTPGYLNIHNIDFKA